MQGNDMRMAQRLQDVDLAIKIVFQLLIKFSRVNRLDGDKSTGLLSGQILRVSSGTKTRRRRGGECGIGLDDGSFREPDTLSASRKGYNKTAFYVPDHARTGREESEAS
jgi:hypothetical protein